MFVLPYSLSVICYQNTAHNISIFHSILQSCPYSPNCKVIIKKTPLRELISLLEQELVRMHYKETTLKYYRVNWARLVRYFESRNEEFYSETVAMEYV